MPRPRRRRPSDNKLDEIFRNAERLPDGRAKDPEVRALAAIVLILVGLLLLGLKLLGANLND